MLNIWDPRRKNLCLFVVCYLISGYLLDIFLHSLLLLIEIVRAFSFL
jgi:hypothetical protein